MIILADTERQVLLDALEDSFNIAKEYSELDIMVDISNCVDMLCRAAKRPAVDIIP